MRVFFIAFCWVLSLSTVALAALPSTHTPWAESLRVQGIIEQELKPLGIQLTQRAVVRFLSQAPSYDAGPKKPRQWKEVRGPLELTGLQVHLFTNRPIPAPIQAVLKARIEKKSGYPFVGPQDFRLSSSNSGDTQKTAETVALGPAPRGKADQGAPLKQPETTNQAPAPVRTEAPAPLAAPTDEQAKADEDRATPAIEASWMTWGGFLIFLIGGLVLLLGRQADSPKKDLAKLNIDLPEKELDFTDLKEFKQPAPAEPEPELPPQSSEPSRAQITNDLIDLLLAKPEWAKELAIQEGPQGLVRLFQLFGETQSFEVFGPHLGKKRVLEIQQSTLSNPLAEEQANRLVERLHQGFFAKKLVELRSLVQAKPAAAAAPDAPAEPKASFFEEEAALAFLADASQSEILRLIVAESPLIQSMVLRHWKGDHDAVTEQLAEQKDFPANQGGEVSPDLLDKIARGIENRLKELRDTPDPQALTEALAQLEDKSNLDRETFLARLSDQDPKLSEAARLNFLDPETFNRLERSLLRFALKPLPVQVIAAGVSGFPKTTQEPVLLALDAKARSEVISLLKAGAPSAQVQGEAKRTLALALNEAQRVS